MSSIVSMASGIMDVVERIVGLLVWPLAILIFVPAVFSAVMNHVSEPNIPIMVMALLGGLIVAAVVARFIKNWEPGDGFVSTIPGRIVALGAMFGLSWLGCNGLKEGIARTCLCSVNWVGMKVGPLLMKVVAFLGESIANFLG